MRVASLLFIVFIKYEEWSPLIIIITFNNSLGRVLFANKMLALKYSNFNKILGNIAIKETLLSCGF